MNKRLEKGFYWAAVAAATGITAWFSGAFIVWLMHQLTLE